MKKPPKKKAKTLEWLDRGLFTSPYCYALCLDEQDFYAELTRLKVPMGSWPPFQKTNRSGATVNFFEHSDECTLCAIVTLRANKDLALEQIYALLVHEAVHIWQAVCEHIGETIPASEQEAYAIQRIAQELMLSYRDQTRDKRK